MVNRLYFILNTILFFCGLFSTVCYDQFGGLWLKGVTSGWFVLIGIVNIVFACKCGTKSAAAPAAGFPAMVMTGCSGEDAYVPPEYHENQMITAKKNNIKKYRSISGRYFMFRTVIQLK